MKRILLSVFILGLTYGVSAQELLTENATALTVGNINTDLTGVNPGQGDWLTFVGVGGAPADFQVVDLGGVYGNTIQVAGPATAVTTGTAKFLFKDISDSWTFRDAGNNIAEVELNFFTGPATTSTGSWRVVLYDSTGTKILGGLLYTYNTRAIRGLSYYDNAGTLNNYSFNFGPAGAIVYLNQNAWHKIGFSYNKTTGEVRFREGSATPIFNGFVPGAAAGTDVTEIDFVTAAAAANTQSALTSFDNLTVAATATDLLLGVSEVGAGLAISEINMFPNPMNDVLNISNPENIKINKVSITDINGRMVKTVNPTTASNTEVNVSELSSGVYVISVDSENGTTTKKLVKN